MISKRLRRLLQICASVPGRGAFWVASTPAHTGACCVHMCANARTSLGLVGRFSAISAQDRKTAVRAGAVPFSRDDVVSKRRVRGVVLRLAASSPWGLAISEVDIRSAGLRHGEPQRSGLREAWGGRWARAGGRLPCRTGEGGQARRARGPNGGGGQQMGDWSRLTDRPCCRQTT